MRKKVEEKPYVIVRANPSGITAGFLESESGTEATLTEARRLWRWYGAVSLGGLAVRGTTQPEKCQFPPPVPRVRITGVAEVIHCTPEGEKSLRDVPEWRI